MNPVIASVLPSEAQLRVLIPIIAIIMGCAIPIVFIIMDALRKKSLFELHHRERLAALERGLPVPEIPEGLLGGAEAPPHPTDTLRRGLIWLFVGIALFFAIQQVAGADKACLGLIPAAVGLANLIYYALVGRKLPNPSSAPQTTTERPPTELG